MKKVFNNLGQTLVELLITIGLAAILIPALLGTFTISRSGRVQMESRVTATSYLKQTQEALRIIQENGWDNFSNGVFHPEISGSTWVLTAGNELLNSVYARQITIDDVYRNTNGDIVLTGGILDPSTKKFTTTVSWSSPIPSSVSSVSYLTRRKNIAHLETSVADFTPGTLNSETTGITITNTNGGEIILGAGGGGGDWCQPSLVLQTQDLPKNGVANAVSAIEGHVFAGTGENASGVSFAKVDVSTNYPPSPTLRETFDGYKTNGVFGDADFAYLATDNNAKEVVIMSLTQYSDPPINSKYLEVGYFNVPGNANGNSVYVAGNYGYMTSGNKFYIFDLTQKSGSRPKTHIADINLAGTGIRTFVVGNYAYVATSSTTNQLQIIDITDKANPTIISNPLSIDALGAKDVFVNISGTRAYLVTGSSATKREFFIIDLQNKAAPVLLDPNAVFDTNGMDPKGVTVVTGNRAIVVGTGGTIQYQVININTENQPIVCGPGLAVATGIHGVSSVLQQDGYAYSYIITGDSASELKIILGGAGAGSNFESYGVFESATFDAGSELAWNTLNATASTSLSTNLQFRVAIKHAINNSCSGVNFSDSDFVGPDKQTSTYFPKEGGLLPFDSNGTDYENPGRCIRYRAYLTSLDSTQTPVVYSVSLNYSP